MVILSARVFLVHLETPSTRKREGACGNGKKPAAEIQSSFQPASGMQHQFSYRKQRFHNQEFFITN